MDVPLGNGAAESSEHQRLAAAGRGRTAGHPAWALSAVLALAALVQGRRRIPVAHALIAIGLDRTCASRSTSFTLPLLLAPYLEKIGESSESRRAPNWTGACRSPHSQSRAGLWARKLTCVRLDGWMPEREAGAFIAANRLTGRPDVVRLGTTIWHFGPGLKVSLDGRRETVYSDAFVTHTQSNAEVLDDLRADYAWLPLSTP